MVRSMRIFLLTFLLGAMLVDYAHAESSFMEKAKSIFKISKPDVSSFAPELAEHIESGLSKLVASKMAALAKLRKKDPSQALEKIDALVHEMRPIALESDVKPYSAIVARLMAISVDLRLELSRHAAAMLRADELLSFVREKLNDEGDLKQVEGLVQMVGWRTAEAIDRTIVELSMTPKPDYGRLMSLLPDKSLLQNEVAIEAVTKLSEEIVEFMNSRQTE